MKNICTKILFTMLVSTVISSSLFAKERKTTLLLHHFMSPKSPTHMKLLKPWAEKLEKDSNGKIKVEIFPSMTMGGKPNELYKQVRDGGADIIWTLAGYTPGVFPRTEVYELPTVHRGDALATTLAIKENMHLIKDDFKRIKPLLIHVHAGNAIHTTDKKVEKLEDVRGLKLRTPSRTGAWYINEMGAEPVGMPLPTFPQALSKKAVDGGLIPFEVFPPYKLHQLTNYSVEGEDGDRFGTSVFMLLMNEKKFKKLSKELQEVIIKNTGIEFSKKAGQLFMDSEKPGIKMQSDSKNSEVIKLSNEAMKEFNNVGQKVVDRWVKEVSRKGIDGDKLVDEARKAILKNSK